MGKTFLKVHVFFKVQGDIWACWLGFGIVCITFIIVTVLLLYTALLKTDFNLDETFTKERKKGFPKY